MSSLSTTTTQTRAWRADHYATHGRFVSELGAELLTWLAPRRGEQILDLGCGDGALTTRLVWVGADVIGVDTAPELVAAAQHRGIDARLADAHALPFDAQFDAVFSNAALHWMRHPDAVLDGVYRALRPGGRFVAELGAAGNIASVVDVLEAALERRGVDPRPCNPWYFPTAEEYRQRLAAHGFMVTALRTFGRPTLLPGDLRGWLQTFAHPFLAQLPASTQDAY
ncbi:MAG TPA: methyltransferase domain-containing protein, partial [Myxococcota bacterium]|nr:methyltransferase domain-containing protein [Myxococcota bacterium]